MSSHTRTLVKTISYRGISTVVTSLVVWFVTRKAELCLSVGVADCCIKMLMYYFHELAWSKFPAVATKAKLVPNCAQLPNDYVI